MQNIITTDHIARSEIMRCAEPEDAFINLCIDTFGTQLTADFLTQRKILTQEFWTLEQGRKLSESILPEQVQKIHEGLSDRISRWAGRNQSMSPEKEFKMAQSYGAWLCIPEDDDWPQQLNDLGEKKPYGLWGRGERSKLQELSLNRCIAVVGSRDTTSYGNSVTSHIVGDLAQTGYCIVSGGAFGIDAVAHRTALSASTSLVPTVSFMACGVDRPYPKHNEHILQEIINQGLLLSEVPLGNSPTRWRFLQRNRLIAALSAYSLVVEARWRSGALNTAHHALSLGREVGSIPGQIFSPNSEGCHRLLKKNFAQLVSTASDITESIHQRFGAYEEQTLDLQYGDVQNMPSQLTEVQQRVWDALPLRKAAPIENLATMCGIDGRTTMVALSQLVSLGLAQNIEQGWKKTR